MILIFKSSHRAWRSKSFHFLVSNFLASMLLLFFVLFQLLVVLRYFNILLLFCFTAAVGGFAF